MMIDIKPTSHRDLPPGDYVSPNLVVVRPDDAFPNLSIGDTSSSSWPYLRREGGHNWYVDSRNPTVGFISRDEAAIVFNTARLFAGHQCLEIGCWRGWSTVHLAIGSRHVDVVDPVLTDPAFRADVETTLGRAGVSDYVRLHALASPDALFAIAGHERKKWAFAFIDADHTGDAPVRDVEAVHEVAAPDALILLHDLLAPEVAAALERLRALGWATAIYQTMQVMGVAVRGRCRPIEHLPDLSHWSSLPAHLTSFAVIGEGCHSTARRLRRILAVGSYETPGMIAGREQPSVEMSLELSAALGVAATMHARPDAVRGYGELDGSDTDGASHLGDLQARCKALAEATAAAKKAQLDVEREWATEREAKLAAIADAQAARREQQRLVALLDQTARDLAIAQSRSDAMPQSTAAHEARIEQLSSECRDLTFLTGWYSARYETQRAIDSFATSVCKPRVLIGLARRGLVRRQAEVRQALIAAFTASGACLPLPDGALDWLARPRTLAGLLRRLLLAGASAPRGTLAASLRAHQYACDDVEAALPQANGGRSALSELRARTQDLTARIQIERDRAERKARALERQLEAEERELNDAYVEIARLKRHVAAFPADKAEAFDEAE